MYLKKDKQQIALDAEMAARQSMQQNMAIGWNTQHGSIAGTLVDLISRAVGEGVRVALENVYTDEEFEKDIGLKS
jgi:2-phosphoglycerate kinase